MRPLSRYVPKPLFPIGSRPVVGYVVDELQVAGSEPIVVIGRPEDTLLRQWVDERAPVIWATQPEPRGLADALVHGYRRLESPGPVYMALPDNFVLEGPGIQRLDEGNVSPSGTVLGTMEVKADEAQYLGNSGHIRTRSVEDTSPFEPIVWRQSKGGGSFDRAVDSFPARRTVGRGILTEPFFRHAAAMDPDPDTGELDDGPVFRQLIQSDQLYARCIRSTVCDLGEPDRYIRAQALVHRKGLPAYAT